MRLARVGLGGSIGLLLFLTLGDWISAAALLAPPAVRDRIQPVLLAACCIPTACLLGAIWLAATRRERAAWIACAVGLLAVFAPATVGDLVLGM